MVPPARCFIGSSTVDGTLIERRLGMLKERELNVIQSTDRYNVVNSMPL